MDEVEKDYCVANARDGQLKQRFKICVSLCSSKNSPDMSSGI